MSAVTVIDGIFVGHGVSTDSVAVVNIAVLVYQMIGRFGFDDWSRMFNSFLYSSIATPITISLGGIMALICLLFYAKDVKLIRLKISKKFYAFFKLHACCVIL